MNNETQQKVSASHLQRIAYLYIRQSSARYRFMSEKLSRGSFEGKDVHCRSYGATSVTL